jgi:hypothetical protein
VLDAPKAKVHLDSFLGAECRLAGCLRRLFGSLGELVWRELQEARIGSWEKRKRAGHCDDERMRMREIL